MLGTLMKDPNMIKKYPTVKQRFYVCMVRKLKANANPHHEPAGSSKGGQFAKKAASELSRTKLVVDSVVGVDGINMHGRDFAEKISIDIAKEWHPSKETIDLINSEEKLNLSKEQVVSSQMMKWTGSSGGVLNKLIVGGVAERLGYGVQYSTDWIVKHPYLAKDMGALGEIMYKKTQSFFSKENIGTVRLYRSAVQGDVFKRQYSSWSTYPGAFITTSLSRKSFFADIPVKQIFSLFTTGFGNKTEAEVVVLGDVKGFPIDLLNNIQANADPKGVCRVPAGNPAGGQFSSCGAGGGSMSGEEALGNYQDRGFLGINSSLRSGSLSKIQQEQVAAIDGLFDGQKAEDVYLFRADGAGISATLFDAVGITKEMGETKLSNFDEFFSSKPPSGKNWDEYFTGKLEGTVFKDNAYVSTSKSKEIVTSKFVDWGQITRHGGVGLVEIIGRSKVLDVDSITGMGAGEKEMLLPRGTAFRIKKVRVDAGNREGYTGVRGEGFRLNYTVEVVNE